MVKHHLVQEKMRAARRTLLGILVVVVVFATGPTRVWASDVDPALSLYDHALNFLKRDSPQAIELFRHLVAHYPDSELSDDSQFHIGVGYTLLGQPDLAVMEYYRVAIGYPQSDYAPEALVKAAEALTALGFHEDAIAMFRKVLEDYPDAEPAAYAQTSIGWLYGGMGNPQKAKAALKKVIVNYPESSYVETARESLKKLALESKSDSSMQEMAFWNSIINSDDPALFETYLKKYPNGVFTLIAREKLDNLAVKSATPKRPDGSHFGNLANQHYSYDLDSDGRIEDILLVPSGENDEGQFYSLLVLDDKAGIIWSGAKELNTENPLVFGEWHYGISMPEVIGDIDGDGVIELVAPAPQSDVSPTVFRILRWENGAFKLVRESSLLEKSLNSGKFLWENNDQTLGTWVSSFQSINSPGEVTGEITDYRGGSEVKMRIAELRKDASGFEIVRWIDDNNEHVKSTKLKTYRTLLSREDHVNSKGVALTDVISILRQDRANYHLNRHRDSEDESDSFFAEASGRKLMKQRSVQCEELNCEQSILGGTPLVEVTVETNSLQIRMLKRNSDKKEVNNKVQTRHSSPIFLDDEMYQYYKTPAQVVYIYTANSLFSQSNVTNVGSPKIKAKQVSIDFVIDGKKEMLVFIEKSRKENEAIVMVGPPRSDATDIYQLLKIKGRWAIVGVKHSNGMQ